MGDTRPDGRPLFGLLLVDSELCKAYEAHHPELPEFAAAAMNAFAERELA